jgi:uncharacterized membrane protein
VNVRPWSLERTIEAALTIGLLVSGGCLLSGLFSGRTGWLRSGTLILMMTPVVRVIVLTIGLIHRRDWLFSLISLWILGVLASSLYLAARIGLAS